MKRLCLLLILWIPAARPQAPPPSPASLATAVWDQLRAVNWDAAYAGWKRARPQLACRQYADAEHTTIPDELWSYRCSDIRQPVETEWLFYALSPDEPVTAHLDQFRAAVTGQPLAQLEAVQRELSTRLASRYGAGQDPGRVSEFGSAFWHDLHRWRVNDLEIYLYLDEVGQAPPRLELQARRRPLLDALAAHLRIRDLAITQWAESGTPLDSQLATQVAAEFPRAAMLLSSPGQPEQEQPALRPALLETLDAARTAAPGRRAVVLLAADRLAGRLLVTDLQAAGWEQERKRLAGYGLSFEWDPLGGVWHYGHELLWLVWQDYSGTPWGQQAFLLILSRGWDTHAACQAGSDQFRAVIQNGERFLRERPQSPLRPQVLLYLGQSYETWWSLSRAGESDDYVDRRKYQDGADAARQRAIDYYQQLLRLPGAGDQAASARLALPRLKLGIDAVQRRFFCVYD
jgi:hypothetical protein